MTTFVDDPVVLESTCLEGLAELHMVLHTFLQDPPTRHLATFEDSIELMTLNDSILMTVQKLKKFTKRFEENNGQGQQLTKEGNEEA
jgi:hypothetical protein